MPKEMPIDVYLVTLLNQIYAFDGINLDVESKNRLYEELDAIEQKILHQWLLDHGWPRNASTLMWEKAAATEVNANG